MTGARQWRADCDCLPSVADDRHTQPWQRMHSQVSARNAQYFISENRLADDEMDEGALLARLEQADGALIVCNNCGKIREATT